MLVVESLVSPLHPLPHLSDLLHWSPLPSCPHSLGLTLHSNIEGLGGAF